MAVADAPFDLLDVKLAAPVARTDTVAKADLTARLRTSSEPVVTVVAGAGYGKTTFLARWAEADPRPFAWVALDGREDEVQLLRYVAAAMHRIEPVADVVLEALSGPRASIWSTRVPRLIRRCPRSSTRWCSCSTICTPSSIRAAWTCSRRCSSTSRRAHRWPS